MTAAAIRVTPAVRYPRSIPAAYAWLKREGAPRCLVQALALHGTLEFKGAADNPLILSWAREVGVAGAYRHDSVAWCGLFAAIVVKRAGYDPVAGPLWALNWRRFGKGVARPMLGDVIVKPRDGGGHVTFYVGEDATHYHCLGGNQSDQVSIVRYPKTGIAWTFRRPIFLIGQPLNVRVVTLASRGAPVASKEA